MSTQEILKKKLTFDTKFTATDQALCLMHINQMLDKPENHRVRSYLLMDKLTSAHAYWARENEQFQLRIDTFDLNPMEPVNCIALFLI